MTTRVKNGETCPALEELKQICKENFREIAYKDNLIITFDRYEGTDAQYFETYEEAIEWEEGYRNMVPLEEVENTYEEEAEIFMTMQ